MGLRRLLLAAPAVSLVAVGCGVPPARGPAELRLAYFPNLTHSAALVAVERGFIARSVGPEVPVRTQVFNAGPEVVEAIFGGSIDAAYIGPNPAINAYVRSDGKAVRIVAGATSGGASLVVQPGIRSVSQLRGRMVATPQLGNTQDVALRYHLKSKGLRTDPQGGGDVRIAPTENATTLGLFRDRRIDAAWVPEPWATRLVVEGGGVRLVDETSLWPEGRFATTLLVVSARYLAAQPATVRKLIAGHLSATRWVNDHPVEAKQAVNASLERLTQKPLPAPVIDEAWTHLTVTSDPIAASLREMASHAHAVELLEEVDLSRIFDLHVLNSELRIRQLPIVVAAGLGKE